MSRPNLIDAIYFDKMLFGKKVHLFTLKNKEGLIAQITNYGGRLVGLWTPDRQNIFEDIVLGYDTIEGYLKTDELYFGALIGRYGNRIDKAKFSLNGKTYDLDANEGDNHLHGGPKGLHNTVWNVKQVNDQQLNLNCSSPNGENGYPGNLEINVTYTLTDANELRIDYRAKTDSATPVNLTHHSYFNLQGAGNGEITDHKLGINADQYIPVDDNMIPLGELATVENTPMDFKTPQLIGKRINDNFKQLQSSNGYDHCWVLNDQSNDLVCSAEVFEPKSGRRMQVFTNEPGLQFYTSNSFNGAIVGKRGKKYVSRGAFCLETQHFPDSPNQKHFPNTILNPDEIYSSFCVYRFDFI